MHTHVHTRARISQSARPQGGTIAAAGLAASVAAGFRGKGLVHAALPCLEHLMRLLPMVQWSVVWQQVCERAGAAVDVQLAYCWCGALDLRF